jgi:hypothetical protein
MVVVFLGTIREGTEVNRGKDMTAGKLRDAFIFQKTVTEECPGGLY